MAFNKSSFFSDTTSAPEQTELAYDLRQIYAKLVGDHLNDIASARKADNYSVYFKSLKDLYIVTQHKLTKEDRIEYKKLMTYAMDLANKYQPEFIGEGKDSKGCALIEDSLNEIEMFLYGAIDEANIFGAKWDDEGL